MDIEKVGKGSDHTYQAFEHHFFAIPSSGH